MCCLLGSLVDGITLVALLPITLLPTIGRGITVGWRIAIGGRITGLRATEGGKGLALGLHFIVGMLGNRFRFCRIGCLGLGFRLRSICFRCLNFCFCYLGFGLRYGRFITCCFSLCYCSLSLCYCSLSLCLRRIGLSLSCFRFSCSCLCLSSRSFCFSSRLLSLGFSLLGFFSILCSVVGRFSNFGLCLHG